MFCYKKIIIILSILFILVFSLYLIYIKAYFNCEYDSNKLLEGKSFLKNKKVIVCGLARNCEQRLLKNKYLIDKVCDLFDDYRVVIVENDSVDNTRRLLLDWTNEDYRYRVLGCDGVNLTDCRLNFEFYANHELDEKRIIKMAYVRNIYLDEIRKSEYKDFDYVIVWDLDILGTLDIKGLYNTGYLLKYNNIDAVCANGIMKGFYYDSYALRYQNDNFYKKFLDFRNVFPYDCENKNVKELYKVRSCFGGFVIYDKNSIIKYKYDTEPDKYKQPICEHEYLNRNLDNVYQSTNFIYYVEDR